MIFCLFICQVKNCPVEFCRPTQNSQKGLSSQLSSLFCKTLSFLLQCDVRWGRKLAAYIFASAAQEIMRQTIFLDYSQFDKKNGLNLEYRTSQALRDKWIWARFFFESPHILPKEWAILDKDVFPMNHRAKQSQIDFNSTAWVEIQNDPSRSVTVANFDSFCCTTKPTVKGQGGLLSPWAVAKSGRWQAVVQE